MIIAQTMARRYVVSARTVTLVMLLILSMLLTACDAMHDDGSADEGGVSGTGIILRGTASENRAFASNQVDIKAESGEVFSGVIDEQGHYSATAAAGSGPWLLRTDLGNGQYRYGIAFGEQIANIHSYSDVILRNWFARNGTGNIDDAFNSNGALPTLPTRSEFQEASAGLFSIVDLVLASYNVTGDQLLFDPFDTDNTGIDKYLDNNPFFVDGDIISIQLTHPTILTQSTSRSLLALDADLSMPDTELPRAPGSVRVLGSASNELVVVWDPAEDDVGIERYEVYRDGQLLEATPYPVYVDSNLQTGTSYRYEVVAVDAAGNASTRSAEVIGNTLGEADTQAPPAPTDLGLLDSGSNRVDLRWNQTGIDDVVRFTVFRGPSTDTLEPLVSVNSNFITDVTVSGDTTYCYQVLAEDASANQSSPSEVLCVDTTDEPSGQPVTGDATVPLNAGLDVPDTLSIACTSTLNVAEITQNTTLSEPCYLVQQSVQVVQFANLTLSAGTVLKFAEDTRLQVNEGASLTINGLPEAPVVLTGQQPLPGYWEGVLVDRSSHPANLIRNTVIEFAGGGGLEGGLTVTSSIGENTRIRIENSLFRNSDRNGFSLPSLGTVLEAFTGNVATLNNRPAVIHLETLNSVAGFNDFSGNDEQIIAVARLTTNNPVVVPDLGVPLLTNGIVSQSSLLIEAGVEFRFWEEGEIRIAGEFISAGTLDKPVRLTAHTPGVADWDGISLLGNSTAELRHTVVEFAGGASDSNPGGDNGGAIELACSAGIPAQLDIADSDIVRSGGWGIYLDEPGCVVTVGQDVRFIDNVSGDINIQ